MAGNFLGFFGKKKGEVPAPQAPLQPVQAVPAAFVPPPNGNPSTKLSPIPTRKKVTQRLSVKGIQQASSGVAGAQKIQLPGANAAAGAHRSEPATPVQVQGAVYLPVSIILQAIPSQCLTAPLTELLARPQARVEAGLPLSMVLPMLPSGKVEFTIQEIASFIPEGFIQPLETMGDTALGTFTLPLFQIASRIPSDAMVLRGDQRPVDASIMGMADPFSPEMLGRTSVQPPEPEAPEIPVPEYAPEPEPVVQTAYQTAPEPEIQIPAEVVQTVEPLPQTEAEMEVQNQMEEPSPALPEPEPVQQAAAESGAGPELTFDPAMLAAAEAELAASQETAPPPAGVDELSEAALSAEEAGVVPEPELNESSAPPVEEPLPAAASQIDWAGALAELNATAKKTVEPAAQIPPAQIEPPPFSEEKNFPVTEIVIPATGDEIPAGMMVEDKEESVPLPQGSLISKLPPLESALSAQTRPISLPLFKRPEVIREPLRPPVRSTETQSVPLPPAAVRPAGAEVPKIMREATRTQRLHFISLSPAVNNLLGVPVSEEIKLKDVVEQIRRWPGVQGCIIAGKDGLPITSVTDDRGFAQTLSAFAPKILARVNELFTDLGMPAAEEVHVPASGTSTFIYRHEDVFFILLHREANVPQWYSTIIRQVLTEIAASKKNG